MTDTDPAKTTRRYVHFAKEEANGRSLLYEALALGVAGDADVLAFLATLPAAKRQPNLLFAAFRLLLGMPSGWSGFRDALLANAGAVRAVMLERSTQTNEPARCATLLPVLAGLPQPLALIEVGASAGLCLLPDCYGYDYGARTLRPGVEGPVFACVANEATPLPAALPTIAWRAGIDLNPIDVTDASQAAWLDALVWPEQVSRLNGLRSAMKIAAAHRPLLVRGDLTGDGLEHLSRDAPKDATLVIFHTAVLAYVTDQRAREAFAARAQALAPVWIANESPLVFPGIASRTTPHADPGRFLLSVNGTPVAWTDPHGASLAWIAAGAGSG
jgi:hypothetical protein